MTYTKSTKFPLRTLAALALALLSTSGCFLVAVGAAGAAGAGTVAYLKGELDAMLGNNFEAVEGAARAAVGQMQFVVVSEAKDSISATLTVRTAQDNKVVIVITRKDTNLTRVQIRVGVFGDEALSRSILERIKHNL